MAEQKNFRGFFSYARDDGETDPGLITALTTELEGRVNARLVNGRLTIWRDSERLKAGERWDETIDGQLRRADVLIVLLTPRWIGSEYCRKEYALFEELEGLRSVGQCVVPVLARPIGQQQERRLTPEQREIHGRINRRQHFQALATEFLKLSRARRRAKIDMLAEHIAGIIEQLTDFPRPGGSTADTESGTGGAGGDTARATRDAVALTATPSSSASRHADADMTDLGVFREAPFAPELVVIPLGEFMMGSREEDEAGYEDERPQHRVMIARHFALGRYPVTFYEYDQFCEATRREKPDDNGWGRGRQPVINVSWQDAQDYIAWLWQETGRSYRLPSEAEWEFACRAGSTSRYSFGDVITPDDANYAGSRLGGTCEVGTYAANPWGLHDMHGNVWEWVEDDWHESYRGAPTDGSAWKETELGRDPRRCALRGGSWVDRPRGCGSARRGWYSVDRRHVTAGFRVARTLC